MKLVGYECANEKRASTLKMLKPFLICSLSCRKLQPKFIPTPSKNSLNREF
jgi:hypothetical protein